MYLDKLRFKFSQNNIPNRVIELIQVPQEQWQPEHTLRYNNLDTHHQTDVNIREKVRAKEEFKLWLESRTSQSRLWTFLSSSAKKEPQKTSQ